MSVTTIHYAYRPARIGWLVKSADMVHVSRAIQLSHMLWGGRYNPLLPADQPALARHLIALFAVDLIYDVERDEASKASLNRGWVIVAMSEWVT